MIDKREEKEWKLCSYSLIKYRKQRKVKGFRLNG